MNTTDTTPAPAAGGRQVGQLLAGRYRLGVFKGGDDIADVWHALDESTEKVVTLEILRDRENEPARQRFLAEAHRMAAIERPSVMRVAAIHNEAADTFIVFEHLIPLPVVLTGLSGIAKDTRPQAPASVAPSPLASVAGPMRSGAAPDVAQGEAVAPAIVDLDVSQMPQVPVSAAPARVPDAAQTVSTSLAAARSEMSGLAQQLVADVQGVVRDAGLDELVAAARARIPRGLDISPLTSLAARVTALASQVVAPLRSLGSMASKVVGPLRSLGSVASKARPSSVPVAKPVKIERAKPVRGDAAPGGSILSTIAAQVGAALPVIASLAMRLGSASRPLIGGVIGRVRPNPVVLAGAIGILILVAFVLSPLDDAVVSALRSAPVFSPATTSQAGLAPAPFELPPLSAYGAAFESQASYPTAAPNATVEWVVALRNTGSVGWYRGIDGAQAALALPDGTGVAVQSTPYVAPGQLGWFVVHFRARAELGTYTVPLLPRIDGRGPLPDLGIFAVVTVAKNP